MRAGVWTAAILSCCAVGLDAGLAVGPPADEVRVDERFLDGLRQRRLYALAESYCRRRLSQTGELPPGGEARLTVELIRTLATWAGHAAPGERPELWRRAAEAAQGFLARHRDGDDPLTPLVRFQYASALLARGQLERQEAEEAAGGAGGAAERAREALREAIRLLNDLDRDLARKPLRSDRPPASAGLSEAQLLALRWNVALHLARARRNIALTYEPGTEDRAAAGALALEELKTPLGQAPLDQPLAWALRLEAARCLRLVGDPQALAQLRTLAEAEAAPAPVRWDARAEAVRLELARGRLDAARRLVDEAPEEAVRESPEWALARLEFLLASWRAEADQADAARRRRDQAVAAVEQLDRVHGAYWGRRAERLLVREAPPSEAERDAELLARSGDELYRKGLDDEAVAAYDRAAEQAAAAGSDRAAFLVGLKAALVRRKQGRWEEVMTRCRRLSLGAPRHPQAPEVHLQAVVAAAELARQDPQRLPDYAALLDEHVRQWPGSPTADQAALWLGRLHEARGQWSKAAAAYQAVSPQSSLFAEAAEGAARARIQRLTLLGSSDPEGAAQQAAAAAAWFRQAAEEAADQPARRAALLAAARLQLRFAGDPAAAEALLRQALGQDARGPAPASGDAAALLAAALALQDGRSSEALAVASRLTQASGSSVLEAVRLLAEASADASPSRAEQLAQVQLALLDRLDEAGAALSEADRRLADLRRAEALAAAGRRTEAVRLMRRVAQASPDDAAVQESLARLLETSDDPGELDEALAQWRRVARRTPLGAPLWYRAKYGAARTLWKLGRPNDAAALIRYVQAVAGLENSGRQRQFLELLRRCETGGPSP